MNAMAKDIGKGFMFTDDAKAFSGFGNHRAQNVGNKYGYRRREDKSDLKCDLSGKIGHVKSGCFKIVGFPDW
ncbi:hypothetical protein LIER_38000 [Lithospermum erythrorhizon]|uniref:Uncharacterized protein n=1 Tax=Lithospermum erythrorhizon TaxID=34254 RepID=A0AAV3PV65_LITER